MRLIYTVNGCMWWRKMSHNRLERAGRGCCMIFSSGIEVPFLKLKTGSRIYKLDLIDF